MSQFDSTKEKDGPPVEVKEVAQYLARYSVFFLICAIIMATVPIVSKRDFDTNALCAVTIPMGLAIIDAICASAFYSLSPWSYSVVYFLLLCHWGGRGLRIFTEEGEERVRQAFARKPES